MSFLGLFGARGQERQLLLLRAQGPTMLYVSSTAKGTSLSLPEGVAWAPFDAAPPAVPRLAAPPCIDGGAGIHPD